MSSSTLPNALIRLHPLYMDRVWGGRTLETRYGRPLPDTGMPFGESWEIVDRLGSKVSSKAAASMVSPCINCGSSTAWRFLVPAPRNRSGFRC